VDGKQCEYYQENYVGLRESHLDVSLRFFCLKMHCTIEPEKDCRVCILSDSLSKDRLSSKEWKRRQLKINF